MRHSDRVASFLNIIAPGALALAGLLLAIVPDLASSNQWVWIAGIAVLWLVSVWAAQRKESAEARQLADWITGGMNVCYLRIRPEDLRASDAKFRTWMEATGPVHDINYWISPAEANCDRHHPLYMSIDRNKLNQIATVYGGSRMWWDQLPPGDYFIEFDGRNGKWVQRLTLALKDGVLTQTITVTRADGSIAVDICDPWRDPITST